ncbi:surface antigen-domain-containing protein [Phascolomyces articulosus]|uniref:Surface antigen-domain-containing protein n=1 Tax=Phascolomyces articulosus TaxID=60185 RepID=A0AAD5JZW1_9FUNG|nr:surface antigen-domain-containing protein [Phascolomyces articulosus]
MDSNVEISEQQKAAARRLFSVLSATAGSSAHVNAVTILGTKATRYGFLSTVTEPVLESKTVADVVNQSQTIAEQLIRLDIFDDVQVLLDRASDTDPLAAPGSINVVYRVKEKSRVFLKTGTEIGNNEGNMNGSVTVRNVFGGAEMLESSASFGTRNSSAFQFALSKPIRGSPDAKFDINAHSVVQNNTLYSSYEEVAKGAGLRYRGVSRYGYHEVGLDCTWRNIDRIADTASMSIRQQAGHSLKTSLRHVYMLDRRDDLLLPSSGHYVKCSQELAGGLGNIRFFKTQLETQYCHRIGGGQLLKDSEGQWVGVHPGLVLSMGFRAGFMAAESATVSDKFMLGGPLSIRGFRTAGVGPRDYRDALGGDAYWAVGLSAISPLPKYEDKPIRAHTFINAGTLVPWKLGTNAQDTLQSLTRSPSVSVGFGLIYRHSIARLELNYCIPLTAARGDLVKRGLQLGVGIDFL